MKIVIKETGFSHICLRGAKEEEIARQEPQHSPPLKKKGKKSVITIRVAVHSIY